uniref:dual-specificity kinase n=1 Tax=Panagrellus redivivus TaxID=6233 RepID=A0A7E4UUA1_PANRE
MASNDSGVGTDSADSASAGSSPMQLSPISSPPFAGLTPIESLEVFGSTMTDYERDEVHHYDAVYFTGVNDIKKLDIATTKSFDDSKGNYRFVLRDHLFYRYEILQAVGSGSFGMVLRCYDHKRQYYCAVKVVRNWPKVSRSAEIEVEMLTHIKRRRQHPGFERIVKLHNFFDFRGHRCIVFELLGPSLYDALKKRKFKGFLPSDVKTAAKPILLALDYLGTRGVIHCDLKPENILFTNDDFSSLKLIDLGSASMNNGTYYSYIQSRFYRAPEVLMQQGFGLPIDMWSFGCILVELITGTPIFAGENRFDQMTVILEVMGLPPMDLRRIGNVASDYFKYDGTPVYCKKKKDKANNITYTPDRSPKGNVRQAPGGKTWDMVFNGCPDPALISILNGCFDYNPQRRFTPCKALLEPWLLLPPEVITID